MPNSITAITNEFTSRIEGSRYVLAHLVGRCNNKGIEIQETADCNFIPVDLANA